MSSLKADLPTAFAPAPILTAPTAKIDPTILADAPWRTTRNDQLISTDESD